MKKKNNENITTSENSNEKKKSWWDEFLSVMHFKSYNEFESPDDAYKKRPRLWIYDIILVLIFVGILVYFAVDVDFMGNITFNETRLGELWNGFINPNWSFFFGYGNFHFNESVIYKIIETFAIGFYWPQPTISFNSFKFHLDFWPLESIIGRYSTIVNLLLIVIRTFPEILFAFALWLKCCCDLDRFAGITASFDSFK